MPISRYISRRSALTGACSALALAGASRPAGGVIIQDDTYHRQGFRAHMALAHQPQFASLLTFSEDEGKTWNHSSGSWLGNFGGSACVLAAGHSFSRDGGADGYLYRTTTGQIRQGRALFRHPDYNDDSNYRGGYDSAIVLLQGTIDDLGAPPLLFARQVEDGERIVMVGYGTRGIGSKGELPELDNAHDNKTAAENTIDEVMEPVHPLPADEDAGNWMRVTLNRESEGGRPLDGILGGGDSGGSAWMQIDGRWGIVGINASGGEQYGEHAFFACIAGLRPWLGHVVPGLRFVE